MPLNPAVGVTVAGCREITVCPPLSTITGPRGPGVGTRGVTVDLRSWYSGNGIGGGCGMASKPPVDGVLGTRGVTVGLSGSYLVEMLLEPATDGLATCETAHF